MGSTFSSLNAGLTGLYAAQRLIEISGQNINNQNTPGYTRQRVEQKALGIGSTPSIYAGSVPQGGGVEVTGIRRLSDFFLDTKLRMETGRAAAAKAIAEGWGDIETAMDELGKKSVSNSLREFYKSWGDVNNNSDNRGARATTIGRAQALVNQIATGYTHVNDMWKNDRESLDAMVTDLNAKLDSINELNQRIRAGKLAGGSTGNVNHLMDQRDQLALEVAKLTGATVREGTQVYNANNAPNPSMVGKTFADGSIELMLGGNSLVGKGYVNHFQVSGARDMPGIDSAPRGKFEASTSALGTANLDQTFTYHGVEMQKYQAQVGRYQVGDTYTMRNAAGNVTGTKVLAAGDEEIGQSYTAYYDMEKVKTTGLNLSTVEGRRAAMVAGTDFGYTLNDYQRDEGEVRITWENGGTLVPIEEGQIGGVMNNLKPAEFPGVSGTIGRGGAYAEAGKLYNDVAANLAEQVNLIHANNQGEPLPGNRIGDNNSRTLVVKSVSFRMMDPSQPEKIKDPTDPNKEIPNPQRYNPPLGSPAINTINRSTYNSDAEFEAAIQAKIKELEAGAPGQSAISEKTMVKGGDFFKFDAADNKLPAALRLRVAITDPQKLAAGELENGIYDGSIALRISNSQDDPTSALNEWAKSVVDVGVHTAATKDNQVLTEQTRALAEQQQHSQASVDMNEEVVNLIAGQHAYAGAARIMSTVNSMLETLINLGR